MKSSSLFVLLASFNAFVRGDVYWQTPPGSNNRYDEKNRERANANRLFDSQNNNRGGYNAGKMVYYHGEKIPHAWTNQHGASKYQMENSEFIVQYMCGPLVRDGTTTRRIPNKPTECQQYDCDTDVRFGRHEAKEFYNRCQHTERNKGLFTANQNLRGNSAQFTRQNPKGTRSGYECPEERDHYPYWNPSPWIDMMIITADPAKCAKYKEESQNVKPRGMCVLNQAYFDAGGKLNNNDLYPTNPTDCAEFGRTRQGVMYNATWQVVPAHGVAAPECQLVTQTRANHLGNPGGRNLYEFTWEIPTTIPAGSKCVTRMRYNITTADYQGFDSAAGIAAGADAEQNSEKKKPNPNNDAANIAILSPGFANQAAAEARGYEFKNNPTPDIFGDGVVTGNIELQLAINTAQFGRTFEDRTHYWFVEARPDDVPADATLKLQTVRGKRGNIVQTFPATEYFFHPEVMYLKANEFVHFAWTGSNTNPNNNDGQGKRGTDRSNMVAQRTSHYDTAKYSNFQWDMTFENGDVDAGAAGNSYPGYVAPPEGYMIPDIYQKELNTKAFGGMSKDMLMQLATTRKTPHDYSNMEELDDAGTGVHFAPVKVTETGCTNYLCSRNNNFSNRAQKGKFCVTEGAVGDLMVGTGGAEWWDDKGRTGVQFWPSSVYGMERAHIIASKEDDTDVVEVRGVNLVKGTGTLTVNVQYIPKALMEAKMVYQPPCTSNTGRPIPCSNEWEYIDYTAKQMNEGEVASADVHNVGTWKVVNEPKVAPILALTVAVVAFALALSYVLYNKCACAKGSGICCCKPAPKSNLGVGNTGIQMNSTAPVATGETGEVPREA